MYNVSGFGKRIAAYRKMLGITQEELATRLNITAQAVSKWENEMSFPDITILPLLSKELNASIEKLFGNQEEALAGAVEYHAPHFPENKGANLRLAHTLGGVACYSEKEVVITNEDTVNFKDGSSANLKQLKIVNKGPGDICFDFMDEIPVYGNIDMSRTELEKVFDNIHSVEMSVNDAAFVLSRSENSRTYVKAQGSPVFLDALKIDKCEGILSVNCDNERYRSQSTGKPNKVLIEFGMDMGRNVRMSINGSGTIQVDVPFKSGTASVNGSGDIKAAAVDDFEGRINGSGDITCGRAGNPKMKINGSGDFSVKEVWGTLEARINGSGDIDLGTGTLEMLEAKINGSGDIKAEGISTRRANIAVEGSGDLTIGRVIEESVEKHSKNSVIKVLKRG